MGWLPDHECKQRIRITLHNIINPNAQFTVYLPTFALSKLPKFREIYHTLSDWERQTRKWIPKD